MIDICLAVSLILIPIQNPIYPFAFTRSLEILRSRGNVGSSANVLRDHWGTRADQNGTKGSVMTKILVDSPACDLIQIS